MRGSNRQPAFVAGMDSPEKARVFVHGFPQQTPGYTVGGAG